jgi:xylitol oxidase
VYEALPFETAVTHLAEILSAGYSVSLFTTWQHASGGLIFEQVWRKCLVAGDAASADANMPDYWLGAKRAAAGHHPIPGVSSEPCTEQLGVPGPWHARLPHFRAEFTPSAGEELQSEYFVTAEDAPAALRAVAGLADRIAPLLYITEIRAIARDEFWLSPAGGRGSSSVALHFTWKPLGAEVLALLPFIEDALLPFHARPHWGKLFTMHAEALAAVYPEMEQFRGLCRRLDPHGKFSSKFTRACGLTPL